VITFKLCICVSLKSTTFSIYIWLSAESPDHNKKLICALYWFKNVEAGKIVLILQY